MNNTFFALIQHVYKSIDREEHEIYIRSHFDLDESELWIKQYNDLKSALNDWSFWEDIHQKISEDKQKVLQSFQVSAEVLDSLHSFLDCVNHEIIENRNERFLICLIRFDNIANLLSEESQLLFSLLKQK